MADTSLKAYYAYLDELLTRQKYDEVMSHAQHILGKYPKNLGALRRLAKAQLETGQYDDALKSYSQVLSYVPQDVAAYVGLSWVYRQRNQGDSAIYFLERAFEREPGNTEVVGLLRDAYRVFHDRANAKLPNSAYMVARQQVKSGLDTQAVRTLLDALAETPQRTDLRLLLTDIYAQIGQPVEAAKSAVAVLKELPDCVRANQLLAVVWMDAGRPSDAQRMVARIEEVDPYLAYEIATGTTPPDEAFVMPLYNYQSGAGHTVSATPDWMSALGDVAPEADAFQPTSPSDVRSEEVAAASWLDSIVPVEESSTQISDDRDALEWLGAFDEVPLQEQQAIQRHTEEWVGSIDPTAVPSPEEQADWLTGAAPIPAPVPAEDDDDSWLAALGAATTEDEPAEAQGEQSWLQDIEDMGGISDAKTIVDRAAFDRMMAENRPAAANPSTEETPAFDFSAFDDASTEKDTESEDMGGVSGLTGLLSALSGGATDEIKDKDGDAAAVPVPTAMTTDDDNDIDPFAWMSEEGIEVLDEPEQSDSFLSDPLGVEEMGVLEPASDDALAWARRSGIELTDDDAAVSAFNDPDVVDPFAWMRESGIEVDTSDELVLPSSEPTLLDGGAAEVWAGEDASDSAEVVDSPVAGEMWPAEEMPSAAEIPAEPERTGMLAFMRASSAQDDDSGGTMGDNNDIPDWLRASSDADDSDDGLGGDELPAEDMDWLAGLESSGEEAAAPAKPAEDDDADMPVPDWMAELDDSRDPQELAALSTVENPVVEAGPTIDEVDSGMFPTLDDIEKQVSSDTLILDMSVYRQQAEGEADAASLEGAADPAAEAPLWAVEDPPTAVATRPAEPASVMPSVTYDPYDDLLLVSGTVEAVSDTPAATDEPSAPTDEAGEDDWLAAMAASAPVVEAEQAASEVADSGMDWLTEAAPDEPVSGDSDSQELDWLSEMAANAPSSAEEATSDDSDPFGASDLGVDADGAPTTAPEVDFASLGFRMDDDEDTTEGEGADPFAAPPTPVAESGLGGDFDWLADSAPAEADAGSAVPSGLDWLNDAAPVLDDAQSDDSDAFTLDFLDEEMPTADVRTIPLEDEQPDALIDRGAVSPRFELDVDVPGEQLGATANLFDEVIDDSDLLMAEESPDGLSETAAISAPDWLNALAPGLEVDTDTVDLSSDSEYLGGSRGDYGWLNTLVDEELRPPALVVTRRAARFPFETPPLWLQSIRDETQQINTLDMDANDDGLPDWLDGLDDADSK
ncbi:MAG: tetratricopeptide repeat protein [Anaerolineae bacterium]|nr:tetratricopeptide repeat protein [Anaerolineae bacterium]